MNERLWELAKQAGLIEFEAIAGSTALAPNIESVVKARKFAELIIRECACIADDMKSLETARAIKEHFGLEGTMNTFTPIDPGPAATQEIADARNDVLDGLL